MNRVEQARSIVSEIDIHQRMRAGRGEETCEACVKRIREALDLLDEYIADGYEILSQADA
jgi:hypothetical protein